MLWYSILEIASAGSHAVVQYTTVVSAGSHVVLQPAASAGSGVPYQYNILQHIEIDNLSRLQPSEYIKFSLNGVIDYSSILKFVFNKIFFTIRTNFLPLNLHNTRVRHGGVRREWSTFVSTHVTLLAPAKCVCLVSSIVKSICKSKFLSSVVFFLLIYLKY